MKNKRKNSLLWTVLSLSKNNRNSRRWPWFKLSQHVGTQSFWWPSDCFFFVSISMLIYQHTKTWRQVNRRCPDMIVVWLDPSSAAHTARVVSASRVLWHVGACIWGNFDDARWHISNTASCLAYMELCSRTGDSICWRKDYSAQCCVESELQKLGMYAI